MRPIWKGSISFGLVNIPVGLYPATRREELKFKLLRASDQSPVNNKRVAEADGKEVPWNQIVKGYEYEKGKFVILKEEDFSRVDIEAAHTVAITDFVDLAEVDPTYFHKPYYMEPEKGGDRAYVLLREALHATNKIGIAKVAIRTREHLAAVKPHQRGLMLELMHFADELLETNEFKTPAALEVGKKEMEMAKQLIASMTTKWRPEQYTDDYRVALEKVIEEKISDPKHAPKRAAAKKQPSNVINLAEMLQQSLNKSSGAKRKPTKAQKAKKAA